MSTLGSGSPHFETGHENGESERNDCFSIIFSMVKMLTQKMKDICKGLTFPHPGLI